MRVPRTRGESQRTRRGSFFAPKPALTYTEQAELLAKRGLDFGGCSSTEVERALSDVNYYRLRGYWLTLEKDGRFIPGTTFQDIVDIYDFDHGFRVTTVSLCEYIEIKFRTVFAYRFSHAIGPDILYRPEVFLNRKRYERSRNEFKSEVKRGLAARVPCVEHNIEKYGMLPIWAATEILSFGAISKLYGNLCDKSLRSEIASDFNTTPYYLKSWIEHLAYIRNVCAHYNRLYNRQMTKQPRLYKKDQDRFGNQRNFATFVVLAYIFQNMSHTPFKKALSDLSNLMEYYPSVSKRPMRFPNDWEKILREIVSRSHSESTIQVG